MRIAPRAVGELDKIHPVLTLPPHLGDHLVHVIGQHSDGVLGCPHPGGLVIDDATVGDDKLAGTGNARPFVQASRDGIAQRHINEPGATRHGKAGHPAAQDLLRIARRPQGAESRVGGAACARDVRHLREPKGEMTVTIDESRHDPLFGGINDLHVILIFDADVRREPPDTPNAVPLDDDGVVDRGRTSRAIDQGPVLNNERFSVTAVHRSLLNGQLFPLPEGEGV